MAIPEYPISRIEHYLARANGQNVTPPDPISRIEHYLDGIAGGVPQELLDDVADLKSHFDLVSKNLYGTETQTDKSNTNYCLVDTLVYGKTYRIGVSVATAGNYGVKVATENSASYVVATLIPDNTPFSANEKKYVLYTPVGNGEKYIRLSSKTVSWSVYVSEVIDAEEIESEINSIAGRTSTLETDVEKIENDLEGTNAYRQILTQTLHVGQSVLTELSVSLGTNWSGTIASGLAHASGSTDPVSFNIATENNSSYLISFTLSNAAEKSVTVGIGDSALVDVYNGTTSVNVGIVADGGYLKIVPSSAWVGTITNLKLRKVGETGDEIELEVKNVDTKVNDPSLTGFWNVIVGVDNFGKNQNGSRNISIGYASLSKLESGTRNICIGTFSMPYVKDGDRNIAIGADSLYSTRNHSHAHAEDCVAIGYRAMSDGTNVKYNIAIGTNAMKESTDTATYNVCVGAGAGMFANYGLVAIGYNSCAKSYTKADSSVFVGRNSGVDNTGATAQNPKNVSNVIAIGDGVLVKNTNDARFGNANNVIYLAGKRIVFNDDHTVTWEEDT